MAREHAPSIIFMEEIVSVEGVKTAAEVVIPDGFEYHATNCIDKFVIWFPYDGR
jgi:hypothetical protein